MKEKCIKCNERGYHERREGGSIFTRSCECGWAIEQQEKMFKGWSVEELVGFLNQRNAYKMRQHE